MQNLPRWATEFSKRVRGIWKNLPWTTVVPINNLLQGHMLVTCLRPQPSPYHRISAIQFYAVMSLAAVYLHLMIAVFVQESTAVMIIVLTDRFLSPTLCHFYHFSTECLKWKERSVRTLQTKLPFLPFSPVSVRIQTSQLGASLHSHLLPFP